MNYFGREAEYTWQTKEIREKLISWQIENGVSLEDTIRAYMDIIKYGHRILGSDLFAISFEQVHHKYTTVGEHTLHVAFKALDIAYKMQKKNKKVNIRYIVEAALGHDLGIIGRYEKFSNNIMCCYLHPKHSVEIIEAFIPDISFEVTTAIAHHMFPATPVPPTTLTGAILIMADKSATIGETVKKKGRIVAVPA